MKTKKIKIRAPRGSITTHYGKYRAEVMIRGVRARDTFGTEEEAQQYLLDVCQQALHGISVERSAITLSELLELFLKSKEAANRKSSTIGNYTVAIRHIKEALGPIPARQLLPEHVDRLLSYLKSTKGFSPKHCYGVFAVLLGALDYGLKRQILLRNVARVVERPRLERPEIKALAQGSMDGFLAILSDLRDRAIFCVMLSTGMRRGELLALKWEDLDLATGTVIIRRRIIRSRTTKGYDISSPKTDHGYRRNKLPQPVLEMVLAWKERQDLERRFYRSWQEAGWLFTSRQHQQAGKHLDPTSINWLLTDYLKKAGLPHITVHGLRHTFCTWLLRKGVPAKDVQQIVGQSKVSVTLDMYWEAVEGAESRVSDEAASFFTPKEPVTPTTAQPVTDFPEITPKQQPSKRHLRAV